MHPCSGCYYPSFWTKEWMSTSNQVIHQITFEKRADSYYGSHQYISAFTFSYRIDDDSWRDYTTQGQLYSGMGYWDHYSTQRSVTLSRPVQAKRVKIDRMSYYSAPSFRYDYLAYTGASTTDAYSFVQSGTRDVYLHIPMTKPFENKWFWVRLDQGGSTLYRYSMPFYLSVYCGDDSFVVTTNTAFTDLGVTYTHWIKREVGSSYSHDARTYLSNTTYLTQKHRDTTADDCSAYVFFAKYTSSGSSLPTSGGTVSLTAPDSSFV